MRNNSPPFSSQLAKAYSGKSRFVTPDACVPEADQQDGKKVCEQSRIYTFLRLDSGVRSACRIVLVTSSRVWIASGVRMNLLSWH